MAFVTLSGEEAEITALVGLFIHILLLFSPSLCCNSVVQLCFFMERRVLPAFYTQCLTKKVSQNFRITLSSLFYSSPGVLMAGTVSITQTAGYIMALKVSERLSLMAELCHREIA